ncbi:hypothetical protein HBI56_105900 [Parastagonospora nodorum]|nr:hypothetical protein HBH56_132990 [Parastagonospora nodorum]KAH3926887.1 hypothetical protein HBH54_160240 [Parastagonospora nodorum]KAH3949326.1 hypothetical protein HBH53_087950 [Parastagonospora nodorum]KAH3977943.1 hypothetical protein HBH51_067930 [Parastagonospora nodorum]KAH3995984.1 hypothetical protein HBI10_164740 [Parastagonospora nodorum]
MSTAVASCIESHRIDIGTTDLQITRKPSRSTDYTVIGATPVQCGRHSRTQFRRWASLSSYHSPIRGFLTSFRPTCRNARN